MKLKIIESYEVPTYALPALINGDYSGLNQEDSENIDNWVERIRKNHSITGAIDFNLVDGTYEAYFSHCPAFGLPCDVVKVNVLYWE